MLSPMSEPEVVPFPATAFEPEAPGIASRAVEVNGVRWAIVQYEPGVLREEWCEEGHSGYVLDGAVSVRVPGRSSRRWPCARARGSRCPTGAVTVAEPVPMGRACFSSTARADQRLTRRNAGT